MRDRSSGIPCWKLLKSRRQLDQLHVLEFAHLLGLAVLSTADYRALHNWFFWHGPLTSQGMDAAIQQGATWVHGVTIVLALRQGVSISTAWDNLRNERGGCGDTLPIMVACVQDLESVIFDQKVGAGDAGLRQWGLDVGPHQDSWDPYKSKAGAKAWRDGSSTKRIRMREKVCNSFTNSVQMLIKDYRRVKGLRYLMVSHK